MANSVVQTGNSAGVNVRASKSTSSTKLGVIDNGVTVNIVRCDSDWATLQYNGTPAFVQHQYLTTVPSTDGDGLSVNDSAKCNANSVNIRSSANGSTVVDTMDKGTSVTIYAKSTTGGYVWYRIGTSRWVRGDFLAPNSSGGGGGTTVPGVVGNGPNSTISAADIRNNGKCWVRDLNTTHPQIKTMQTYVNDWVTSNFTDLGWLSANGVYNDDTILFVKRFQYYCTNPSIAVDGLVGPATLAHIEALYSTIY